MNTKLLSICAGNFGQVEVDSLVEEGLKMSQFRHANVMCLVGVCLDTGSAPWIIMPFMANGSLSNYLHRERGRTVLPQGTDEDEVIASLLIFPDVLAGILSVDKGGLQAIGSHVSPDSQWDGVPGSQEIRPPRPRCQELHVSPNTSRLNVRIHCVLQD